VSTDLSGSNTIGTVATDLSGSNNIGTVATNIASVNSFANIYRIGSTNPTTSLDEGDLFYNSTDNVLKYYNGSAWTNVESTDISNLATNGFAIAMAIAL
jgi:hypothetical protein